MCRWCSGMDQKCKGTSKGKRERARNFEEAEKRMVLDLVKIYLPVIENKKTDALSLRERNRVWDEITQKYNSSCFMPRTCKQLRGLYDNVKRAARRLLRHGKAPKTSNAHLRQPRLRPSESSCSSDAVVLEGNAVNKEILLQEEQILYSLCQDVEESSPPLLLQVIPRSSKDPPEPSLQHPVMSCVLSHVESLQSEASDAGSLQAELPAEAEVPSQVELPTQGNIFAATSEKDQQCSSFGVEQTQSEIKCSSLKQKENVISVTDVIETETITSITEKTEIDTNHTATSQAEPSLAAMASHTNASKLSAFEVTLPQQDLLQERAVCHNSHEGDVMESELTSEAWTASSVSSTSQSFGVGLSVVSNSPRSNSALLQRRKTNTSERELRCQLLREMIQVQREKRKIMKQEMAQKIRMMEKEAQAKCKEAALKRKILVLELKLKQKEFGSKSRKSVKR